MPANGLRKVAIAPVSREFVIFRASARCRQAH